MSEIVKATAEFYRLFVTNPKNGKSNKYTFATLEMAEENFKRWATIKNYLVRLEKRLVVDTEIKVKYSNKELK